MKTENVRIGSESQHAMTSIYPQRVRFGPFEADLETHELWKNGIKVKLGGQPFEILAVLLNRPGQLVTREELQREIWAADTFVDFNHGLNAAVNKLRETLSDSAEEPKYIETLPRRGYRFIGTIENAGSELKPEGGMSGPRELAALPPAMLTPVEGEWTSKLGQVLQTREDSTLSRKFLVLSAAAAAITLILWWLALKPAHNDPEYGEYKEKAEEAARTGTLSKMVTLVPDLASDPAISPDGNSVAFRRNSYAPGAAGIFVTAGNAKALKQLTEHPGDCCPAWSPDGKMIAYSRIAADEYGIYVVDAKGGAPRKISHEDPRKKRGELAWTADGKFIAFSGDSPTGGSQIFLLSVEDSSVRPLTEPQGQDRDWGPAFSPDGTRMVFVRANGAGFPEELFVLVLNSGSTQMVGYKRADGAVFVTTTNNEPIQQVTNQRAAIMGPPAWSADGQSIIFSSTKAGEPSLWKVPARGGEATQIGGTGTATWHPTVARKDGKLVVFMSDRSGSLEIWESNQDGSAAVQLTNLRGCGTPRWSPDGMWIAFDSVGNGAQGV